MTACEHRRGCRRTIDIGDPMCDGCRVLFEARVHRGECTPIETYARALNAAPKVAEVPFSLTADVYTSRRERQGMLF